jgi:hypothetical protein
VEVSGVLTEALSARHDLHADAGGR